ncbi:MAG: hypothetical protein ACR2MQ_11255, partial [Gemmatimonadaceae bacterium]
RDAGSELKHLAHDVRNALNGVSVNLEVARSRAARGSDISQIAPFLETAAQQLDVATRLHKRFTDVATQLAAQLDSSDTAVHP